ncbi:MAG: DUF222 domain-containing protein [Candidatus Dormibacteraceae bacterium]
MEALGGGIRALSAHLNAALAELAGLVAAFDEGEGWAEGGIRSCPHWLSINAGLDQHSGAELLRVGRALASLPAIRQAFAAGELSLDKARALTRVATAADEGVWLEVGRQASGSQLARLCREYRRAVAADDEERAEEQLARRGLWSHWREGGMLHLEALLGPEDGALVLAALEAVAKVPPRGGGTEPGSDGVPDPARDSWAAVRADALVAIGGHVLTCGGGELVEETAPVRLLVHVDVGVLTGEDPDGRCHPEGGPALSAAAARRLGCDAEVVTVTEREGLPIDAGRAHRIVSTKLRRALRGRDRGCRFPGCGVAAGRTQAHHLEHWAAGGRTDLANLASLCWFHHRRLHEGAYRIRPGEVGELRFESARGRPIVPAPLPLDPRGGGAHLRRRHRRRAIEPTAPVAGGGGEPCDHDYAVSVLADACARLKAPGVAGDARSAGAG